MARVLEGELRVTLPSELYVNVPVAEALLDVVAREGAGSLLLAWDDAARFIVGDVSGELRSAGVDVVEYHVEGGCGGLGYPAARARELAGALEASGAELLVGLGSGCLLSLAKLAWLLRHRPTLEPGRILPGARLGVRGARPKLVAAPIGGAGREVDNAAVLEEEGRALAVITPEIVPSYAIVDPALSLPGPSRRRILDLLADTIVHAFDSMLSALANPVSEAFSHLTIRSLYSEAERLGERLAEPVDGAWAMLASASLLASLAAGTASVSLTCSLALAAQEALGVEEHGLVAASFLPLVLEYYQSRRPASERLARLAREISAADRRGGPPTPSGQAARLLRLLGAPAGLRDLGVSRGELESKAGEIALRALELAPGRLAVERPTVEELRGIIARAYNWGEQAT